MKKEIKEQLSSQSLILTYRAIQSDASLIAKSL